MDKPLVSICSITYNHAPYIRQCLDGFLMQKTNFKYEIIIHDDASTDGTAEIIKEYVEKYPDLITPIFQTENQYSKGVRGMFPKFCFPRAKGKYIALCEGDDYWTDPLKLQKQVDFLEANPEYVMCGHRLSAYIQDKGDFVPFDTGINGAYELKDLITNERFCSTLSIVFRKSVLNLKKYLLYKKSMDISLAFHLLSQGKGFCINEEMAVYRIHNGGVWSGTNESSHIINNLEVRIAIYDVENNDESAIFIQRYIMGLGRQWMIKHPSIIIKSLYRICKQFGVLYMAKFILALLLKRHYFLENLVWIQK